MDGGLRTDKAAYIAVGEVNSAGYTFYSFELVATFTNLTSRPMLLGRCGPESPQPFRVLRLVDGQPGASGYNPIWQCLAYDQRS